MCNAWNHSLECNCGWGGSGSGGRTTVNLSTPISRVVDNSRSSCTSQVEDAKTYPTKCWMCDKEPVYYHTQGYGDCVLFDSLGCPWQVHQCWVEYWEEESAKRNLFKSLNREHHVLTIKNADQQKRSIIIGAARQIEGVTFGSFGFYGATEEAVARQIGISVEQLRQGYGHLYTVDSAGIRLLKSLHKKHKIESQQPKSSIRTKSLGNSGIIVICPLCQIKVIKGSLEQHRCRQDS